ncbi:MAG TPA: SDR family NAD(P)-dependent oxidoreductase [Polyangia bacterium]|nr:SDR family NAD(P)-dependent oxidoreductase [Polyangia bacterium]
MTETTQPTKSYLVTGATRGLGLAAVRALAATANGERRQILLAVRDVDAGAKLAAELTRDHVTARALPLDLSSLEAVRRFAAAPGFDGPLAGLACNAGGQSFTALRRTRDGWEETIAVNHFAHVALVEGLLPRLRGGRVVFIGSMTHDTTDFMTRRLFRYHGGHWTSARALAAGDTSETDAAQAARDRYATSKLANVATMVELARRHAPAELQSFALDPGLMPGTGLARNHPARLQAVWNYILPLLTPLLTPFFPGASTVKRSGAALAWLLTDGALAGQTGRYFNYRRREIAPSADARDPALAARIVDESLAFVAA